MIISPNCQNLDLTLYINTLCFSSTPLNSALMVLEMADTPKLDEDFCCEAGTGRLIEDNYMETEKIISVLDHVNGLKYTAEKSESFVIDMDSLSHATTINKDIINSNSRLTKSLSRKGSSRGNEKKINNQNNSDPNDSLTTSSPRGPSMLEKVTVGTNSDGSSNPQSHHQITVTASHNVYGATTEGRCIIRRNSFKRYSSSWVLDPKRVLFLFATLSSIGTMLLIIFTLSIAKLNVDEISLD